MELIQRPRRLRGSDAVRRLCRETRMSPDSLIYPIFVDETLKGVRPIEALPGQNHYGLDSVHLAVEECLAAGVNHCILFGLPATKDAVGSSAWAEDGVVQQAIRAIKAKYPDFYVITDVCMCEYTDHGHCGILHGHEVDNDKTLEVLAKTALSHVQAGADMVAPSDMMDGRVAAIRAALDEHGYTGTPIMAYSAKYASAFYGPFRSAAGSAPSFGDRKGYQMDPHNGREALKECALDIEEGADIIMVKPALSY
ncbi:porphobilinogen synthase, partial [uncultured Flavonifractor sp.]|uniref:porphobilinogen synthase n=1 Tax=uncultured Flavonifractor sp. TaxID=1193534 RepID=UPI002607DBAE